MPTNDAQEALGQLRAKGPLYRLYQDYFNGDHRLVFATDKFRNAFGRLFREFADNHCPAVVEAVADRLELTGFGTETGDDLSAAAWEIWTNNRMDLRADQVHLEALRAGDGYVLVWPSRDNPTAATIYPQKAHLVTVQYDEEEPGRILWAAKAWVARDPDDRKRWRPYLTLYYPDRIEKYVGPTQSDEALPEKAERFVKREVPGEGWPLRNEFGRVPIFHFANGADIGHCGKSELSNVIPVQDALNKSILDMMVGMEYVALPQRYAAGIEVEVDESTGKPKVPFIAGAERVWVTPNEEATFGEFPGASLEQFLKVQDAFRLEVARVSSTPPHYMALITDPPSGEALKTLEARFTKKCGKRQKAFGNTWEDALLFAIQIQQRAANGRLASQWVDPAPRSEKEHAETVAIKQGIGIPLEQAFKELGYPEKDIPGLVAAKQAEQKASRAMGAELLTAFDRGQNGDEE